MHTQTHPSPVSHHSSPDDVREHAARLIEERIGQWHKLHRALVAAKALAGDVHAGRPGRMRVKCPEASVRLLQHKRDERVEQ